MTGRRARHPAAALLAAASAPAFAFAPETPLTGKDD